MFDEERLDDHHECKAAYDAAIRRAEEAEEVRDATIKVRDDVLMELESWKVLHQDEVNARVNAENDLYAMSQERRREHDLRVKINNDAETLRDAHRTAVDRHSVTLNELTAARSALTAERTRREGLEARIRALESLLRDIYAAETPIDYLWCTPPWSDICDRLCELLPDVTHSSGGSEHE